MAVTDQQSPDARHSRIKRAANLVVHNQQASQRQDSLEDQLIDLHITATKFGMYDAADWLWKKMQAKGMGS